ncbi:PREDICTED: uncharacterized protein LOC109581549 isoform X2 [Amphimedon queenslandica]|uniref:Uncharacterized protein n=1 Tax=Amphimedon queenslandica TaxID=400682 RepID=A0A1X7V0W1_AMPQE|nr:PREDICTED: uncharacterized protein LOC109581549 isoform X2 [Amphimedon queenslandica]|eukprot:XP_019851319.1 PREDICTED: uncharacterized protein LOC109581549 isoform X2 [Amphimedon queenslandica]
MIRMNVSHRYWIRILIILMLFPLLLLLFPPVVVALSIGIGAYCIYRFLTSSDNNAELRNAIKEKEIKIARLKQETDELKERIPQPEYPTALGKKRDELLKKYTVKNFEDSFKNVTGCLLELVLVHCQSYVEVPEESVVTKPMEESNGKLINVIKKDHIQKDYYRAYGLLLSACIKSVPHPKKEKKQKDLAKQVLAKIRSNQEYKFVKGVQIVDEFVNASLELTHSMLILLPPLLLIQPQWQHDDVQDTNRKTWDESLCSDDDTDLIYYRPVLVHGNQLQVSVRGLVGNTTTAIY